MSNNKILIRNFQRERENDFSLYVENIKFISLSLQIRFWKCFNQLPRPRIFLKAYQGFITFVLLISKKKIVVVEVSF